MRQLSGCYDIWIDSRLTAVNFLLHISKILRNFGDLISKPANMQFDHIIESLDRIRAVVDGCKNDTLSALERDVLLDELRRVYSAIKFANYDNREAVVKAAVAGDSIADTAEPEPEAAEVSEEANSDSVSDTANPNPETEAKAEEPVKEKQVGAEPVVSPKSDKNSPENVVQSLFNEGEIAVSRRRRMIVRSLYDDGTSEKESRMVEETDATEKRTSSEPQKTNPMSILSELIGMPANTGISYTNTEYDSERVASEAETYVEPETEVEPETKVEAAVETETETEGVAETKQNDSTPAQHLSAIEMLEQKHERAAIDKKSESILGEVLNSEIKTVADTISAPENLASEVLRHTAPLKLEDSIGVNDRFLLIRDLFGGDAAAYNRAISELNNFGTFDECMLYIVENYDWDPYAEGAKLLIGLIERKYGTRS